MQSAAGEALPPLTWPDVAGLLISEVGAGIVLVAVIVVAVAWAMWRHQPTGESLKPPPPPGGLTPEQAAQLSRIDTGVQILKDRMPRQ